jgi:Tfp pilus assembly protein PilF
MVAALGFGWVVRRQLRLGDRARDSRDWGRAARRYKAALRLNPAMTGIWVQYGHALKESGRRPAAETAYRRALMQDHHNAETHLQLGHLLKLEGRHNEAAVEYATAHVLDPALDDAAQELRELGFCLLNAGRFAELEAGYRDRTFERQAQTELREELELQLYGLRSDLQRAINHSGRLAMRLRDAENTIEALRTGSEAPPATATIPRNEGAAVRPETERLRPMIVPASGNLQDQPGNADRSTSIIEPLRYTNVTGDIGTGDGKSDPTHGEVRIEELEREMTSLKRDMLFLRGQIGAASCDPVSYPVKPIETLLGEIGRLIGCVVETIRQENGSPVSRKDESELRRSA